MFCGLQLGDVGEELRPGRRAPTMIPACVKSVLVVPEPDDADVVRNAVLLAVHLPAGGRAADGLDPRRDVLRDVGDLAGLDLVDELRRRPTPGRRRAGCSTAGASGIFVFCSCFVLERDGLDRDVRMRLVELLRDLVPELERLRPGWRCATRRASRSVFPWPAAAGRARAGRSRRRRRPPRARAPSSSVIRVLLPRRRRPSSDVNPCSRPVASSRRECDRPRAEVRQPLSITISKIGVLSHPMTERQVTIGDVAAAGGRLGRDRLEGDQRPLRRRRGDLGAGAGGDRGARLPRRASSPRACAAAART